MTKATLSLAVLAFTAFAAQAQAPAPAAAAPAAPAPAAPAIKHSCVKAEWPGRVATQTASKRFDAEHKAYGDCIRAFVADQSKQNQEAVAKANAHVAAGNAAIGEYNDYVKELNRVTGKEDKKDEKK